MRFNLVSVLLASSFVISCGSNKSNEKSNVLQDNQHSMSCSAYSGPYGFLFRYIGRKQKIGDIYVENRSSSRQVEILYAKDFLLNKTGNRYIWIHKNRNQVRVTINTSNARFSIKYKDQFVRGTCP